MWGRWLGLLVKLLLFVAGFERGFFSPKVYKAFSPEKIMVWEHCVGVQPFLLLIFAW